MDGFFEITGEIGKSFRTGLWNPPTHLNPFAERIEKPVRKIGPPLTLSFPEIITPHGIWRSVLSLESLVGFTPWESGCSGRHETRRIYSLSKMMQIAFCWVFTEIRTWHLEGACLHYIASIVPPARYSSFCWNSPQDSRLEKAVRQLFRDRSFLTRQAAVCRRLWGGCSIYRETAVWRRLSDSCFQIGIWQAFNTPQDSRMQAAVRLRFLLPCGSSRQAAVCR